MKNGKFQFQFLSLFFSLSFSHYYCYYFLLFYPTPRGNLQAIYCPEARLVDSERLFSVHTSSLSRITPTSSSRRWRSVYNKVARVISCRRSHQSESIPSTCFFFFMTSIFSKLCLCLPSSMVAIFSLSTEKTTMSHEIDLDMSFEVKYFISLSYFFLLVKEKI